MLPTEHHHGGASGGASAGVDLLPFGVQVAWFAITLTLTGLHLAEFVGTPRGLRGRSATHLAMAAGMAYMYLPGDAHPVSWTAIAVASAVASAAVGGIAVRDRARRVDDVAVAGIAACEPAARPGRVPMAGTGRWDRARLIDAAGLAAMAYMFHAVGPAQTAVFYSLATVYALAAVQAAWTARTVPARVTGVVMHASMAYMFLAMNPRGGQFVEQARTAGSEQWWWALAIGLLLLRAAADPHLWKLREPARTLPE